ncbi:hypothetical protein CYY_002558 [Polysphondylium violaceum]|uniref:FNIP repeat-containing protein n=1 Tax=Polysphondylium violaceum TaxID=133409 RepID=A0A8J4Q7S9_9MYCE|nr:hypothetical protein CYY_002558 [Polysphondylium violaceum]
MDNNTISFFSIWRNFYIKKIITENVIYQGLTCSITIPFLLKHSDYLWKQRINYNTNIELKVYDSHFRENIKEFLECKRDDLITKITFNKLFNQALPINFFNQGLVSIDFGLCFDQELTSTFPNSVETIILSIKYNKPLNANLFPINLKKLCIGSGFNNIIEGSFPSTLETLTLGTSFQFNDREEQVFSQNLTDVSISLKNNTIPKVMLSSIKRLSIEDKSVNLDKQQFPKLSHLKISYGGNTTLETDFIPKDIKNLKLQTIVPSKNFYFPPHLQVLELINIPYNNNLVIPVTVTKLLINFPFIQKPLSKTFIPPSVTKLNLGNTFIQSGTLSNTNVTNLTFCGNFKYELLAGDLPSSLTKLNMNWRSVLSSQFQQEFKGTIFPNSLLDIELPSSSCKFEANVLPKGIKRLVYHTRNFQIKQFPTNLSDLTIINDDDKIDFNDFCFPSCLKKLKLIQYNSLKIQGQIPNHITYLDLMECQSSNINQDFIPRDIVSLKNSPPLLTPNLKETFPSLLFISMKNSSFQKSTKDLKIPNTLREFKIF